ncbi:2Fe-2S iron-sulfur cluster-binding protein [Chelatococcus reniformis]|uniref:Ferredoxin n=1 Tax=Chelatococcus reniformis TaxID=1494448 RepID=A0A916UJ44_9HYPH|nr:2Fe-2S iron-sulfur cluster-binding protein [Chelatococcus reniformis]GGC74906.1 ferredoxin [Chelatococcus reniformis]
MTRIVFATADGGRHEVEADAGASVMEAAVGAGVPGITADCGGACSCATCHVHVDAQWLERVGAPEEHEAALLEFADNVGPFSRLSCQIQVSDELDGLALSVP